MDLFQYHVNEEKINLEIAILQNKAAEIEAKGGDQMNVLVEICNQIDALQYQLSQLIRPKIRII